jgi:hypothetical protein
MNPVPPVTTVFMDVSPHTGKETIDPAYFCVGMSLLIRRVTKTVMV